MKKTILSFKQKLELKAILDAHITMASDGIHCWYHTPGYNDLVVSAEYELKTGIKCTPIVVAGLRRELFGNFSSTGPTAAQNGMVGRIEQLEAHVRFIADNLGITLQSPAVLYEPKESTHD